MDKFVIRKQRKESDQVTSTSSRTEHSEPSTSRRDVASNVDETCPNDIGTLQSGPAQPRNLQFPKDSDGRKFCPEWYSRFPWLEYSQKEDTAFCYACRHFAPTTSFNYATFALRGYSGWKRAVGDKNKGLEKHSRASSHLAAMCLLEERNKRDSSGQSVMELVTSEVYEKRRYYVRAIAEVVQFLALHKLPFRGDHDKASNCEHSCFNDLFRFMASRDERLQNIIKEIPSNATYTSPEIQNDVIDVLAKMVIDSVVHDVNNADVPCITLLADGTRDKNNRENISIALRYVKDGKPYESLLCMPESRKLDASSLASLLVQTLRDTGIKVENIVCQCYDGATVMSGDKGGVQRLVQNELGREIPYIHCFNHRLHLVVIGVVTRLQEIQQYFDQVGVIYAFFQKMKAAEIYEGTSIKRVLDTRWNGHLNAITAILSNYPELMQALQKISSRGCSQVDGEMVVTATGLLKIMATKQFRFITVMMKRVLELLKPADQALQRRQTDISEATDLIYTCKELVEGLRNDATYSQLLKNCEELIVGHEPPAKRSRDVGPPSCMEDFVMLAQDGHREPLHSKQLLYSVVDNVTLELQRRFSDSGWLYKAITAISRKSESFLDSDTLSPLSRLGIVIPSSAELEVCKAYLQGLNLDIEENDPNRLLQLLYDQRAAFRDTYALVASVATLGSSTAVCEASFSTMKLINEPHRRSMTHVRQRNLVLLAFEQSRTKRINMDDFIDLFKPKHTRLNLSP